MGCRRFVAQLAIRTLDKPCNLDVSYPVLSGVSYPALAFRTLTNRTIHAMHNNDLDLIRPSSLLHRVDLAV